MQVCEKCRNFFAKTRPRGGELGYTAYFFVHIFSKNEILAEMERLLSARALRKGFDFDRLDEVENFALILLNSKNNNQKSCSSKCTYKKIYAAL